MTFTFALPILRLLVDFFGSCSSPAPPCPRLCHGICTSPSQILMTNVGDSSSTRAGESLCLPSTRRQRVGSLQHLLGEPGISDECLFVIGGFAIAFILQLCCERPADRLGVIELGPVNGCHHLNQAKTNFVASEKPWISGTSLETSITRGRICGARYWVGHMGLIQGKSRHYAHIQTGFVMAIWSTEM